MYIYKYKEALQMINILETTHNMICFNSMKQLLKNRLKKVISNRIQIHSIEI